MALEPNCSACDDLKETSPNFAVNGFTNSMCTSLQNNTGLVPSSGHDDCEDLNDLNDCLVGNMAREVDSYQSCDWKKFAKAFIPNLWTTIKALICAICGLFKRVDQQECLLDVMFNGVNFRVDEQPSEGGSYVVAGKGISFLIPQGSQTGIADASLNYIGGALVYGSASLQWFQQDFTDRASCVNYDNGAAERTSQSRKGNSEWANTGAHAGGELLLEFRVSRTEYPMIKNFFNGMGQETGGGSYQVRALRFNEGQYAYGQHGGCNIETGEGHSGMDDGHLVPEGYTYVQLRLTSLFQAIPNDTQYSPAWLMGVRLNKQETGC